jgi:hypothetical protein
MPIELKEAALLGLRHLREQVVSKIRDLERELRGSPDAEPAPHKRRSMSAAARRRIASAQRKRWAEYHAQQKAAENPATKKAPRKRTGRRLA